MGHEEQKLDKNDAEVKGSELNEQDMDKQGSLMKRELPIE